MTDPRVMGRVLDGQEIVFNLAYDVRASAAENLAAFDVLLAAAAKAGRRPDRPYLLHRRP